MARQRVEILTTPHKVYFVMCSNELCDKEYDSDGHTGNGWIEVRTGYRGPEGSWRDDMERFCSWGCIGIWAADRHVKS